MLISYQNGQTSVILRVKLRQDTTGAKPGDGITGLSNTSTGLIVATITDVEATTTAYTSSGSTIQTISTLGTYSAPSAGDCRFGQVDSTNHPGVYEIQLANARYAVSGAKSLLVSITGVSGMADCDVVIPLLGVNPYDSVHGGMSALPNTACTGNASLLTSGTGTDQLSVSAGKVLLQATQTGVTIPTVTTVTNQLTGGQIATAIWQDTTGSDFTTNNSIGKSLYTSGNAPGAANGIALVGSNMGTVSSVTGSVGSISGVTFPSGFSSLTTTAIASAVWQDATAGDFTVASSIGKSLYTTGNAPGAASGLALVGSNMGSVTSVSGAVGSISGVTFPSGFSTLTVAAIATGVWTDTTSGDFTTTSSPGKILVTQLGGAFTTTSSSVYTTASLANAPSGGGGGGPTAAQIATAVWQDTTSGDFTVAGSIGKSLYTSGNAPGAANGIALVGSNMGTVASVTGAVGSIAGVTFPANFSSLVIASGTGVVNVNLAQAVPTSNTAQTVGDALNAARAQGFGKWVISGTTLTLYAGDNATVVRTFTLDSSTTPTQRV
jgi:hypothetical protein